MPYEDRPGAYWALVEDGKPELRRTGLRPRGGRRAHPRGRLADGRPVDPARTCWRFRRRREAAEFFESQRSSVATRLRRRPRSSPSLRCRASSTNASAARVRRRSRCQAIPIRRGGTPVAEIDDLESPCRSRRPSAGGRSRSRHRRQRAPGRCRCRRTGRRFAARGRSGGADPRRAASCGRCGTPISGCSTQLAQASASGLATRAASRPGRRSTYGSRKSSTVSYGPGSSGRTTKLRSSSPRSTRRDELAVVRGLAQR